MGYSYRTLWEIFHIYVYVVLLVYIWIASATPYTVTGNVFENERLDTHTFCIVIVTNVLTSSSFKNLTS